MVPREDDWSEMKVESDLAWYETEADWGCAAAVLRLPTPLTRKEATVTGQSQKICPVVRQEREVRRG